MNNKETFARNLQKYMDLNNKSRKDVCAALGVSYYTFTDWINAKKYPRIDRIELIANYFGIMKSDLIEDKLNEETKKDNDILVDVIVRLRSDEVFRDVVVSLYKIDDAKLTSMKQLLVAFLK